MVCEGITVVWSVWLIMAIVCLFLRLGPKLIVTGTCCSAIAVCAVRARVVVLVVTYVRTGTFYCKGHGSVVR